MDGDRSFESEYREEDDGVGSVCDRGCSSSGVPGAATICGTGAEDVEDSGLALS